MVRFIAYNFTFRSILKLETSPLILKLRPFMNLKHLHNSISTWSISSSKTKPENGQYITQIPIYSYKRTGHTRSTLRLRARSQLPSLRAAPDGPTTSLRAAPDGPATCTSVSTSLPLSFLPSAPGELGKSSPPSESGTSGGSTRGSQRRRTPLAIGAGFSVVPRLLSTESDTSWGFV